MVHIRIRDNRVRLMFRIFRKLTVPALLGASFIDECITSISLTNRKEDCSFQLSVCANLGSTQRDEREDNKIAYGIRCQQLYNTRPRNQLRARSKNGSSSAICRGNRVSVE